MGGTGRYIDWNLAFRFLHIEWLGITSKHLWLVALRVAGAHRE